MKNNYLKILFILFFILNITVLFAQEDSITSEKAQEAYNKPNYLEPDELFNRAKQCLTNGQLGDARLYSLRLYYDGNRNVNLINMLGMIEIQAGRPLLGSEWLRKACSLSINNKTAQK